MGVLEQVSQLKSQNVPEQEIINRLRQQGISPKDINDALSQSQIKNAVYTPQEVAPPSGEQIPMQEREEAAYIPQTRDIEQPGPVPQPQEFYPPQPQEEYAAPQGVYHQEGYGYPEETYDSGMMVEIAEQVFAEKIKKMKQQIDNIEETMTLLQTQTEHITERLKRTELIIDKLEVAVLERVGSYGRNLESIKKEMQMIEDSFSKIIPGAKKISHRTRKTSRRR